MLSVARRWTADLEAGNAAAISRIASDMWQIDLSPDPVRNWTLGYRFVLTAVAGQALTLLFRYAVGGASPYHEIAPTQWRPFWSEDEGATWSRASAVSWNSGTKTITWETPTFTGNTLWVGHSAPHYGARQYASDRARWLASGLVTQTLIGHSVQGRPIYRFTVDDPAFTGAKRRIAQYRTGHEGEWFATWRVRGMLDWVLGSDADAVAWRARNRLEVVLVANPDAIVNGFMRTTVEGIHTNRFATENNQESGTPAGPTLSQEGQEQYALHLDLEENLSDLDLFFDHHTSSTTGADRMNPGPNSTDLPSIAQQSTHDPTGFLGSPTDDTWTTNRFSHRMVEHRIGGRCAVIEGRAGHYVNGQLCTPTTAAAVGRIWMKMADSAVWAG